MSEPSQKLLEGNGAGLVRERAIARTVQRALERLYQIESAADVEAFLEAADDGEREALFVREADDGALEMLVRVPRLGEDGASLDPLCQIIEGVSHFVYLAERACRGREATQLELELQAEVDKYVILAAAMRDFDVARSEALRTQLYEVVSFAHPNGTDVGDRYRVANDLAGRYARRLEKHYLARGRYRELRAELRSFYRLGQEEKLRATRAA